MGLAERIYEEAKTLPEDAARKVLDYVGAVKLARAEGSSLYGVDVSEFDQFERVYDGSFKRDESYGPPRIR